MKSIYYALPRVVLASIGILLLFAEPSFAQRLIYRVDLTHSDRHSVDVNIQLMDIRPDTLVFQMPVWAPGVYSTVNYGRFIENFQALDSEGHDLTVVHEDTNIWKVPNGETIARVTYKVSDSHSDPSSPEIGLARIDKNGIFANTEALFGYFDNDESIPGTIIFTVPKSWMVATTLEPASDGELSGTTRFHQTVFNIDDYSDLANSPLLIAPKFETAQFTRDGVEYSVVGDGPNPLPADSIAAAANPIVRAETSFFGKVPFDRYLFVFESESNGGPFGIAHEKSSVYTVPGGNWEQSASATEHLLASTLFKTWNGGRFHISQLGPVDYTTPIEARSLWFFEGASEYYGELLRVRYGLTTPAEFYSAIDEWEVHSVAGDTASLESLSKRMGRFDPPCAECLRARGALAALTLDIEIRDKTKRNHSLDNVILRMDRDVPHGRTYDDAKFDQTLSKYAAVDLSEFYERYIHRADLLPLEADLEKLGAGSDVPASMRSGGEMGINLALNTAGTAIIDAPIVDSVEAEEMLADERSCPIQLKKGDTVSAIDGEAVCDESVQDAKARLVKGRTVKLTVVRNAKAVPVVLRAKRTKPAAMKFAALEQPSAQQVLFRRSIIGKRTLQKPKLVYRNSTSRKPAYRLMAKRNVER